ncbi:MAG: hypothetical protein COZ88_00270 [Candidatus Nealsonbacteria bacterium CG_4_8_14_3_um_filter_34_13]|nr:MAG: hypothetical protein COZ88_00270 [Candidatus Nealsonbacteria bacterium CG_4_8_14_3_um_filter_34_13]
MFKCLYDSMKVGLISFHSFLKPGGVKNHVLGLAKEFRKRGIKTKIIVPRRKLKENYGKDIILLGTSIPFKLWGTQGDICFNFNPVAIDKTLKKEKFDILHFHNFGIPSAWQILEKSRALNILTFHANIEKSVLLKKLPGILYPFKKIINWKINGIIGIAPFNLKLFKDFPGEKTVIPNGISLKQFNPRVLPIKKFCSDDKISILFVGRLEERKGLIYLLKAYEILQKKFSNLQLIIVGKGPLEKDCQNFSKEHHLQKVYFEGEKSEKVMPEYFASCDIFCSPAIFGESFGIVLLEAMACQKPIVAFSNQGYKEFMKGKKGERFLVKPRAYQALAGKLEILIRNKGLRREMGKWGRKEAEEYSWPKISEKILDFYQLCARTKQEKTLTEIRKSVRVIK